MFELFGINLLAVTVCAIASIALGFMWYGPLFGKTWMSLMKIKMPNPDKMPSMHKEYALALLGSFVTAYVLAHFIKLIGASGWMGGLQTGLWAGVGFLATKAISSVIWEGRPWKVYMINVSYDLVNLVIMGVILGAWM